jgi:phosphoribosylformimino-5-aminoimidazole carboxamide ribotide isomerase
MREEKHVREYLESGVDRVVLGTVAVKDLSLFVRLSNSYPREVNLALDCKGDAVVVKGWVEEGGLKAAELLGQLGDVPFGEVIYTEISRDGTLEGIDVEGLARMVQLSPRPVVASGGVGSIEDVRTAKGKGAWGIIVGKALYDGRLALEDALAAAE